MTSTMQDASRDDLTYHDHLQEIITSLSTGFINLAAEDIDAGINDALRGVGEFADVDRSYVFLISRDRMSNTHEWCRDGVSSQMANLQDVPTNAYPWCLSRLMRGESAYIRSVAELPDDQPDKLLLREERIKSLLAVPIMCKGIVIGFVGFDSVRSEKAWARGDIALLKVIGAIFGNAIERKRVEEVLHREAEFTSGILESEADLVIVFDSSGQCIRVNRAFTDLTGLSADAVNQKGWKSVLPSEHHQAARRALGRALLGQKGSFESTACTKDAEQRSIVWNAAVIRSRDTAHQKVVITGSDVTEVRALREQVEQTRRVESLGRVAATIAHEFNNVLMAISPFAELIHRHPEHSQKVRDAADRIKRAVRLGERITQQVSRFARPSEPVRQEIAAGEWTRHVLDDVRPMVQERSKSTVELELQVTTSSTVMADPAQMQQVLTNLVLNAVDAMPSGGRIAVAVEEISSHERLPYTESDAARWVHWQVTDTGTGIPPAVLEHLFEPLFTTKQRGTGLGLAVAHQMVTGHGGIIAVDTKVSEGTIFHVFIPAANPSVE